MRMLRWLIPMLILLTSSLACFATASDDDDSSVPMSSGEKLIIIDSGMIPLATFTPSATYDGPPPTPYPTTDPAQFEAFTTSSDSDGAGGISAVVPLIGLIGLAFGLFAGVIWYKDRQSGGRRPKSE